MKRYKSAITVFTVLLFVLPIAAYAAAAEIQHPRLVVYGQVSKPVYPGRSIWEYKDDEGLSSTLPFERQAKNISISFANIVFSTEIENKTVSKATSSKSTELSLTKDVLTSGGLEYVYLKITNSSALSTSSNYYAKLLLTTEERAVSSDDYILVTAQVKRLAGGNLSDWRVDCGFKVTDTGGTDRWLTVEVHGPSGTDSIKSISDVWSTGVSGVSYVTYNHDAAYITVQVQIKRLLTAASLSWTPSKLVGVGFFVRFSTGSAVDASSSVEAKVRHAIIPAGKVYIDDGSENSLILNGTSGNFPYSAGETIQVYGANATKIVSVTIPWQVEVSPEISKDPDNLRMQYTWEWTMPKSPSSVGDTLTFSNTNMTLYGYKDGSAWDKLYLNGVDKLSSIASKKVPTSGTVDYWTYALTSSLTEGNMYQVIARVTYTADEYDSLTTAPLFWSNPFAWIQYKFWSLVIAVAAFLGLGTTWAVKQRRKAQIPKVK